MMHRRFFIGGLFPAILAFFAVYAEPSALRAEQDAGAFIMDLADRAIATLTDPALERADREDRFRELLQEGMDVPHVAGRVLGPYVRRATEEELTEFTGLLEENIVRKYSIMFKGYTGETIELRETKSGRRGTQLVTVVVNSTSAAPPIPMRWVVHEVDSKLKVIDIIVERVSMVTTQKEEFVSVIRRGGGKIQALLDELKERNAELAQS